MKHFLIILLLLTPLLTFSQLVTSSAQSPNNLVQNVLLGQGVTVSNISFSGSPLAIGSFDASNTNLGINEGIVMTTGTIQDGTTAMPGGGGTIRTGPQGPNDYDNAGFESNTPGFAALSQLINGTPTYNAAILEFDFVPFSDSVQFNYVFGSEEYPEYVGSAFNDVFAFFISGPGINGLQNIARLPNNTPVAINNIHNTVTNGGVTYPAQNAQYYVDNGDGNTAPQNSNPTYIQYDGYTKVLTAEAAVQCGQTYHLIICIAEIGRASCRERVYAPV